MWDMPLAFYALYPLYWGWTEGQLEYAKKWALEAHGLVLVDRRDIQDAWDIENMEPPPGYIQVTVRAGKLHVHNPLNIQ